MKFEEFVQDLSRALVSPDPVDLFEVKIASLGGKTFMLLKGKGFRDLAEILKGPENPGRCETISTSLGSYRVYPDNPLGSFDSIAPSHMAALFYAGPHWGHRVPNISSIMLGSSYWVGWAQVHPEDLENGAILEITNGASSNEEILKHVIRVATAFYSRAFNLIGISALVRRIDNA
jgi:hypothetical protein